MRHADRGVRTTWEDVFAAVLGLTWKETSLSDGPLWRTLEDFVIWQTCERGHLPVSPWVEKKARKRVGEVFTPIQWLETKGIVATGEGFGWHKSQLARGEKEKGQEEEEERAVEDQRVIDEVFAEGEHSRNKRNAK